MGKIASFFGSLHCVPLIACFHYKVHISDKVNDSSRETQGHLALLRLDFARIQPLLHQLQAA